MAKRSILGRKLIKTFGRPQEKVLSPRPRTKQQEGGSAFEHRKTVPMVQVVDKINVSMDH